MSFSTGRGVGNTPETAVKGMENKGNYKKRRKVLFWMNIKSTIIDCKSL